MRFIPLALLPCLLLTCTAFAEDKPTGIPNDYKLLYSQDFSSPDAIKDFVFTDASVWKITESDGKKALELTGKSNYKPTHRSPFNIALIGTKIFGDCIFEAECTQTSREYGHRDMCFIYGFQSPTQFYYSHVATKPDDHAHNCFIVKDAPRLKFAKDVSGGVDWGKLGTWRKVRVERKASDGTVRVWFDNMEKPIMTAEEKTFGPGYIGFGSFDDTGMITNIRVWGKSAEDKQAPPFPASK